MCWLGIKILSQACKPSMKENNIWGFINIEKGKDHKSQKSGFRQVLKEKKKMIEEIKIYVVCNWNRC